MKKILLLGFLALGIGASAQFDLKQGWDTTTGVLLFGGSPGLSNSQYCTAAPSIQNATTSASLIAVGMQMGAIGQYTNGKEITVSSGYKKIAGTGTGTAQLFYAYVTDPSNPNTWSITYIGSPVTVSTAADCKTITAVIPEGTLTDTTINYGFGLAFTRSGSANSTIYFDDLVVKQVNPLPPACTTLLSPANNAVDVLVRPTFTWKPATGAASYKFSLGLTPGGSELINNAPLTGTSVGLQGPLDGNTKYYYRVTSVNDNGETAVCAEFNFTTGQNSALPYCGPLSTYESVDPISNVDFAGINNASSNVLDGSDSHEFFLKSSDTYASVRRGNAYPIIVKGNVGGQYTDAVTVFIDWNQDGAFGADETYFTSAANGGFVTMKQTATGSTVQSTSNTGNIAVPMEAKLGNTRMRIKKSYIGNSTVAASTSLLTNVGLVDPCSDQNYGQIEDYNVMVDEYLAVNDINKSNVTVYPNPFKDVLKISDVKDATSVIVSDISGRTVAELKPAAELNLSHLNKGVYVVNIKYSNGEVKTTKVIKE